MQTELKPCPFCGSRNIGTAVAESESEYMRNYTVVCIQCGIGIFKARMNEGMFPFTEQEEAEAAWNRRANDDQG